MRVPLLATLTLMVFRQTGKLPESKTKLYKVFTELLSGGWDSAKGVFRESKFGQPIKLMALRSLAIWLHEHNSTDFNVEDFHEATHMTMGKAKPEDRDDLLSEIVEDGLVSKSGNIFQFSHFSFQEFLAASEIIGDPTPSRIHRVLDTILFGNNWWKEIWGFYVGLSGKPQIITNWVIAQLGKIGVELPQMQVEDVFKAIIEAFPEFPIEEAVNDRLNYKVDFSRLRESLI